MENERIAKILQEMAALYQMRDEPFKPRAYERAALSIGGYGEPLSELYRHGGKEALRSVPGVGEGIAGHIAELLERGTFKEYERLKKKMPVDLGGLMAIEGVGAKMVQILWKKLEIKNVADLEKAARSGKIRTLSHFGERSEQKILKGIEFLKHSAGRGVLGFILPQLRAIEKTIGEFAGVESAVIAGSARRWKETIGDIDILVASKKPDLVTKQFLALPFIAHVYGSGHTKTLVRLKNGMDADLRVIFPKSFGAALNYFTGSKDHNVALREIALKKGCKLNEYGLYKDKRLIAGRTEEELYKALGLQYIEPELREMTGELEAARKKKLPPLVEFSDLRGDLQMQTDWTDGENSIEEMAQAAKNAGLEYIAITDHTRSLAMTGGADEKKLLKQMAAIGEINRRFEDLGFRVLKGAEVNIGEYGSLDIKDEVLAKLDVVGAAVHSHFNLSRAEQTKRIIKAMESPHVDIIFHLTGRIIGKRAAIDVEVDALIAAAGRTGTVLEIDAYPDRLDIKDEYIRKCVEAGVKMSIDSDAHSVTHLKYLELGVHQARRGWATRNDIINAWPVEKMLEMLKK